VLKHRILFPILDVLGDRCTDTWIGKPVMDNQLDAIYQTFLRERALVAEGLPVVPMLGDGASCDGL
jgi:hypothetical protein